MTDERRMNEDPTPRPDAADAVVEDGAAARAEAEAAVATEAAADDETAGAGAADGNGAAEGGAGGSAELEALQEEMNALNERHLRLAAEFDNYRKRNERERGELWTRAQADLVTRLLDTLDDLQRVAGIEDEAATVASLLEGVRLVEKKFRHTLESAGLEPIDAEGEFFNPATMEALMTLPAERAEDDELVADVFQKGYRFKDALIRPARVRVKKYEPAE